MSKPYTQADFSNNVTEDRNWRIKEISDLKDAARRGDSHLQKVLLRALVAICYAHWEGYVRFAARHFLEHIALRKFAYATLNRQFLRNYFLPRLGALSAAKADLVSRCALVDEILDASSKRFSYVNTDLVNTRSNLNTEVLADICLVCGVPFSLFEERATFIDVALLKRRNAIAHGEETFVALGDADELVNTTIALMRTFGDALENQIVLQTYKAA